MGGLFNLFGDSIQGEFVEIVKNEKLVERWRFKDWTKGHFSTVTLTFTAVGSGDETVLALVQTDVPDADAYGNRDVPEKVQFFFRLSCSCSSSCAIVGCFF